ncbi:hypothetical protein VTN77DRAFT_5400 [Rasamsonia byssochlamydoides]|uniref:uncharacterized protein n=1 Tax=Rasamsonia byssochlamydoides TaxID=89139 RepID=UPI003743BB62
MSTPVQIRFGVKLELVTGSKTTEHMDWHSTAQELSEQLAAAGLPNHVNKDHSKEAEVYDEWSIIQEGAWSSCLLY